MDLGRVITHKRADNMPSESQLKKSTTTDYNHPRALLSTVYTDDRSLDETMVVHDSDVVMVPRGYHPAGAPHGYDLYYLNVMAGPQRV